MKTKKELRKEILQRRDALSTNERKIKSHEITERICQMNEFTDADKVLLFASYKSEVDTSEIFTAAQKQKKEIYYPKVLGKEMEFYQVQTKEELLEGYRGIREPEANSERIFVPQPEDKIFVLMPGAVFDEEGNRIGYGGGFYDKYLQHLDKILKKERTIVQEDFAEGKTVSIIAVAFDCQIIESGKIEKEVHDIKIEYIVTESKVISTI